MRTTIFKTLLFANTLALVFLISAFSNFRATQKISLLDAVKTGVINADLTSNGKYSGLSVNVELNNTTKSPLHVIIPAGTQYHPEDNGEQTLIQVEDKLIVLKPNGTFRGQVAAFCTEANDRSPSEASNMRITKNTNPTFDKLFAYLKGKAITKSTYQDAVWAISDGHSIANIVADKPADVAFRKHIAEITGQKNTWFTSPQRIQVDEEGNFNRETVKISGDLSFECPPGTKVLQDIHKENGDAFFISDKHMTARYGKVNYAFNLSVLGWEKGTYYIRIHDGENEFARYTFTV